LNDRLLCPKSGLDRLEEAFIYTCVCVEHYDNLVMAIKLVSLLNPPGQRRPFAGPPTAGTNMDLRPSILSRYCRLIAAVIRNNVYSVGRLNQPAE
jgi:hypothetical protein